VLCVGAAVHGCGRDSRRATPLAPAGSPRDDGSGVLARLSTGAGLNRSERARASEAPARESGAVLGRADARAHRAGEGSPYADYHFDRAARPHSAPLPYASRYIPAVPAEVGAIEGTVVWTQLPPSAQPPAKAAAGCPVERPPSAVAPGAVAYLEDISTGRLLLGRTNSAYPGPAKHLQVGGVIEWRGCRFHPAVQVTAPVGSVLALTSADEAVHVRATRVNGSARERLWSIALGGPGAVHEQLLAREGIVELRAERSTGADAASAWVVVAPHPYFAVTDEHGRFTLEEVPPGTYTLVVWHPPITVAFTDSGEPITRPVPALRRRVLVSPRQARRALVRLPAVR
jgi:hypothetical protein